jgi:biopolymer transport protein ExbD
MAGGTESEDDGIISGINVTPLVDVILVLLVIFMVTAKIIVSQGMPMDLPKAAKGEAVQTVFSVDLTADGQTRVDSDLIENDEAIGALARKAKEKDADLRAVIRADRQVQHGRVIHVLDLLKRAEVSKIAFAVSPISEGVPIESDSAQKPTPESPAP